MSIGAANTESNTKAMGKRTGKRPGRKPSKIDERAKLERSRQSARECRARKKLRYQYLEELVLHREKAVFALRDELEIYKQWCCQLDNEEQIPESLLKMIVNEDISINKKQMDMTTRSILQQHEFLISSSSSSSSESSPPPTHSISKQPRYETRMEPSLYSQSMLAQPSSSSLPQHHISDISLPHHHHSGLEHNPQLLAHKHSPGASFLQRQLTVNSLQSANKYLSQTQQSQKQSVPKEVSHVQNTASGQNSESGYLSQTQFDHQQKKEKEKWLLHHHKILTTIPTTDDHSLPQQRSQKLFIPLNSKAGSLLKYEHSLEKSRISSTTGVDSLVHSPGDVPQGSEKRRARSLSNPASMLSLTRPKTTFTQSMSSLPHGQATETQQGSQSFGMFTGTLLKSGAPSLILNIPTVATIEESSSSDENVNEQQLFMSTLLSQKRMLSDSSSSRIPKPSTSSTKVSSSASTTWNFDPQVQLDNLTTVRCFSTTRTCNTPSPSSFGFTPYRPLSPAPNILYTGKSTSTPSSSASASPAPTSSISSIHELSASSPGMCSSTFDPNLDIIDQTSLRQLSSSSNLDPSCSTTGLSASIDEPIPELYSFLADLVHGGMSSLTSRHGATSSHSTPIALTPKPHDQPSTPDPSFTNVPKIINEFLESDNDDMTTHSN